ncbi:hypothetical protein [Roseivirga sp. E12]|uniref:hypothetical protein n=1 Tax=Roseivirga sp. E12 TaxID=2819237 RepID=UPI001ABD15D1|nr:hypothetical protein [Roseivirga sp. E12]MBO3700160.1 hypothetical protein [Roseivirga sp. E12]
MKRPSDIDLLRKVVQTKLKDGYEQPPIDGYERISQRLSKQTAVAKPGYKTLGLTVLVVAGLTAILYLISDSNNLASANQTQINKQPRVDKSQAKTQKDTIASEVIMTDQSDTLDIGSAQNDLLSDNILTKNNENDSVRQNGSQSTDRVINAVLSRPGEETNNQAINARTVPVSEGVFSTPTKRVGSKETIIALSKTQNTSLNNKVSSPQSLKQSESNNPNTQVNKKLIDKVANKSTTEEGIAILDSTLQSPSFGRVSGPKDSSDSKVFFKKAIASYKPDSNQISQLSLLTDVPENLLEIEQLTYYTRSRTSYFYEIQLTTLAFELRDIDPENFVAHNQNGEWSANNLGIKLGFGLNHLLTKNFSFKGGTRISYFSRVNSFDVAKRIVGGDIRLNDQSAPTYYVTESRTDIINHYGLGLNLGIEIKLNSTRYIGFNIDYSKSFASGTFDTSLLSLNGYFNLTSFTLQRSLVIVELHISQGISSWQNDLLGYKARMIGFNLRHNLWRKK